MMSVCLVDSDRFSRELSNHQFQKINKWALKLIGLVNGDISAEDLLEFVSLHVQPHSIEALVYDSFNNFFTLFLTNVDSFCQLVGKKGSTGSHTIRFLPLLDFFVVDNVYPFTTNDDLCDTFGKFGQVFHVSNYHILPNSPKFSHVLSGKREVSFALPGDETEVCIPINVFDPPYKYHVRKLCSACMTEGHSVLNCPDMEGQSDADASSDTELGCILKTESLSEFGDCENVSVLEYRKANEDNVGCDGKINGNESAASTSSKLAVELHDGEGNSSSIATTSTQGPVFAHSDSSKDSSEPNDVENVKKTEEKKNSFFKGLLEKRKYQRILSCNEDPMEADEESSAVKIKKKRRLRQKSLSSDTSTTSDAAIY